MFATIGELWLVATVLCGAISLCAKTCSEPIRISTENLLFECKKALDYQGFVMFRLLFDVGLTVLVRQPLYVSYVEVPEKEQSIHRNELESTIAALPPTSTLHGSHPHEWTYTCFRLFPFLRDCIRRSKVLILRAKGETLSDLFGYFREASPDGIGSYTGRVWLGPRRSTFTQTADQITKNLEKIRTSPKIQALDALEELTIEITDTTYFHAFPSVPKLWKLTFISHTPHALLPYSATSERGQLFDKEDTAFLKGHAEVADFPRLKDLNIQIQRLNLHSLHYLLMDISAVLTTLTLDTSIDILCKYNPPSRCILLPSLQRLSVSQLTAPLFEHVRIWDCPLLEELRVSLPSRLPVLESLDTSNYPKLKKLGFIYPQSRGIKFDSTGSPPEFGDHGGELELKEQCASSRLLLKALEGAPKVEELEVEGWVFSCLWEEVDWIRYLTPRRVPPPLVEHSPCASMTMKEMRRRVRESFMWQPISADGLLLDVDGLPLDIFSDASDGSITDGEEIERRWQEVIEGKVKDEMAEGDANNSSEKVYDASLDPGQSIDPSKSSGTGIDRELRRGRKARGWEDVLEKDVETLAEAEEDEAWAWDPTTFTCHSLRIMEFRNCIGLEKTQLFRCMKEREVLSVSKEVSTASREDAAHVPLQNEAERRNSEKEEGAPLVSQSTMSIWSRASSQTSAAASSEPSPDTESATPVPFSTGLLSSASDPTLPSPELEQAVPGVSHTLIAPQPFFSLTVTVSSSSLAQEQLDALYGKYLAKEYRIPAAQSPREPTPITPDRRVLWI